MWPFVGKKGKWFSPQGGFGGQLGHNLCTIGGYSKHPKTSHFTMQKRQKARGNAMLWAMVLLFGATVGIFQLMKAWPMEQWLIGSIVLLCIPCVPFALRAHLKKKKDEAGFKGPGGPSTLQGLGGEEKPAHRPKKIQSEPNANATTPTTLGEPPAAPVVTKHVEVSTTTPVSQVAPRPVFFIEQLEFLEQQLTGPELDDEPAAPLVEDVPFLTRWIMPKQVVTIHGQTIQGGLFYTGSWESEISLDSEPSMVDAALPVSFHGRHGPLEKGTTYLTMSPRQRGAYLSWLAGGRQDPHIDQSFVALYFHGMERRLVTDVIKNKAGAAMLPPMVRELKKILELHGSIDRIDALDLRNAILSLLNLLTALDPSRKLHEEDFFDSQTSDEQVEVLTRIAVAKAALAEQPMSANLALSWLQNNSLVRIPTAALITKRYFDPLFMEAYQNLYPSGVVASKKTWGLQIKYTPSSPSLKNRGTCVFTFDALPNIAIDLESSKKIQAVVDEAAKPLQPFCEEVEACGGKVTVRARLSLPSRFYTDSLLASFHDLHKRVAKTPQAFEVKELAALVGMKAGDFPDVAVPLATALVEQGIGMEPDVLNGAKAPGPRGKLVLFALLDEFGLVQEFGGAKFGAEGQATAQLALQLACLVGSADGDLGIHEMGYLKEVILSWTHLPENVRRRLLAHMRLLRVVPVSLASVKSKTGALDALQKQFCLDLVKAVAVLDGNFSASKMKSKVFEKVCQALA
jgi:TerB N-terminal domain